MAMEVNEIDWDSKPSFSQQLFSATARAKWIFYYFHISSAWKLSSYVKASSSSCFFVNLPGRSKYLFFYPGLIGGLTSFGEKKREKEYIYHYHTWQVSEYPHSHSHWIMDAYTFLEPLYTQLATNYQGNQGDNIQFSDQKNS